MEEARKEQVRIEAMIKKQWDFENQENIGFKEEWMNVEFDDSGWKNMTCPTEWSSVEEIGMLDGVVFVLC